MKNSSKREKNSTNKSSLQNAKDGTNRLAKKSSESKVAALSTSESQLKKIQIQHIEGLKNIENRLREKPDGFFLKTIKSLFPSLMPKGTPSLVSLRNIEEVKRVVSLLLPKELAVFSFVISSYLFNGRLPLEYLLKSYYNRSLKNRKDKTDNSKKEKDETAFTPNSTSENQIAIISEKKQNRQGFSSNNKLAQKLENSSNNIDEDCSKNLLSDDEIDDWDLLFSGKVYRGTRGEEMLFYASVNNSFMLFTVDSIRGYITYNKGQNRGDLVFYAADRKILENLRKRRHNLVKELQELSFWVNKIDFFYTLTIKFDYHA